jgi:L-Ala-D/L-Glu epimerase
MKSQESSKRGISRKAFLQTSGAAMFALSGLKGQVKGAQGRSGSMEIKVQRLHLRHTWTISRNSSDYKDNVIVRVTRDGLSGFGEAAPNVRYGESTDRTIERLEGLRSLIERFEWLHFSDLKSELDRAITDQSCAKAALDIAILDWVGKKLNQPLFRLFGLDPARAPLTTFSIGIDQPDVVREKVREAADYPVLKIKVGTDSDAAMIKAVRSVTNKPLRVDANEGWTTREHALEKILWLERQGVELIEQPLPSSMLEETKWLRERVRIPIIADEAVKTAADIPLLASAYDGINIKLMKSGGIQEALTMIRMARALGLQVMLGCMIESSVAIAAAAHLSPLVDYADLDGNLLISDDPFQGLGVDKGKLILSNGPGLGIGPVG